MKEPMEKLSYFVKMATDILFVKNPVGTSMGVLFGVIFDGAIKILAQFFAPVLALKKAGVGLVYFVALGIFAFNGKTWWGVIRLIRRSSSILILSRARLLRV